MDFDLGAVIPARLESSRVRHKVLQSLDGREPLIERKVRQLRAVLPADRVVVNTESEIIADLGRKAGASIIYRDSYFSDGHRASFSELIVHVVENLNFEHVAWTPCVVPFFESDDFLSSFNNYRRHVLNGCYDSLVSVVPVKSYLWSEHGPLNYEASKSHVISQELPDWYSVTNGNYMAPKTVMLDREYLLGDTTFLDVKPEICGIDIDTVVDLQIARAISGHHR